MFDNSHKILMGDLNADLLSESDDAKCVRKLAAELSLQLVQHGPTHFTPTSNTWIDVILTDDNDDVIDGRSVPAPFHSKSFQYRDFKNICPDLLAAQLSSCDWLPFDAAVIDTELALDCLCNNLTAAIDTLAPIKTFVPKKGRLPWVDAELAQFYRKRDALYRRYKRTGDTSLLEAFIMLRKQTDQHTEIARTSYYYDRLFDALVSNNVWK